MNETLIRFVETLTKEPGIYRMLDAQKTVLYVGKASNLKKRISSYFLKQNENTKTQVLMDQVTAIEITVTRTETEALLLESNLIKSLRPKYNVLLRDDKTYPYIHVSAQHLFPRMEIYRTRKKPVGNDFYGPYPSATAVRETLQLIQKIFKIRNCSDNYFHARSRPCLQYEIKRCTAPCVGYISEADYEQSIRDARAFLEGKSNLLMNTMKTRMQNASDCMDFEEAARLRDQIKALRHIQEPQAMINPKGNVDVIALEVQPGFACIQYVNIRQGQVIASQSFFPDVPYLTGAIDMSDLWEQILTAFISFYYLEIPGRIPEKIITNCPLENKALLESILTQAQGKQSKIQLNPRGASKRWLDFAENNLRISVEEHRISAKTLENRYQALESLLQAEKPIEHMECFDISHTQGVATVASCVVFDRSGPSTSLYRRFNINNITPGDDYAAMNQAITRRFKRLSEEGLAFPDLLIIDGGAGQVSAAVKALQALEVNAVKVIGIAKGPKRKAGLETLIMHDMQRSLNLPDDSPALHLLQHIRNESHRFALLAHRKKRGKTSFESSLESIEGIGPKRKKALLSRFGGIRELSKASVEEIAKVEGINQSLAIKIHRHFHA